MERSLAEDEATADPDSGMSWELDASEAGRETSDDGVLPDAWTDLDDLSPIPEPRGPSRTEGRDRGGNTDAAKSGKDAIPSDDIVGSYLSRIGEIPLLSEEQEVELAKAIERGSRAQEQLEDSSDPEATLNADLLAELRRQVSEAEEARQRFIEANTRLVVHEAKRYQGCGLSFMDLVQAGNEGLIKAVDRFDRSYGNRFSTYAVWWIRQSMRRALTRQGHTIRLPAHVRQRVLALQRTARRLEKRLGRRPRVDEISSALGAESPQRVRRLLQIARRPVSLNTPVGGIDGDSELVEFIEDDVPSPVQTVQEHLMQEHLETLMKDVLSARELEIVHKRFGMRGEEPQTLQELADDLGISRERVRQIQRRALRKLRRPPSWRALRGYLA